MTEALDRAFAHRQSLDVRWSDMDALGHVNNARFFSFDECVRLDYFAALGASFSGSGQGLIVAHIEADFKSQLEAPARLDVGYRVTRLGRSSIDTESWMFVGERLTTTVRATVVWFDYDRQRPAPIPDEIRSRIQALEKQPPQV